MSVQPWTFEADGGLFRLVSEAWRIRWAHLFDAFLAVDTSLVEPLPHQVTAVYEVMLRRQPLRFLLADDPGAGKTIMTGLLVKELWLRGDLRRCLIVAPGNLVVQWQEELARRLALSFELLSQKMIEAAGVEKVFDRYPLLIARLDKLARDKALQAQLKRSEWDLIVCDEAHKMSATFFGGKVKYTKRYRLGKLLSAITRHFLLLTATPHNGKEADFQLFLALLDEDRFAGRFRDGLHEVDASDLMRRMVKEKLVRFDGTPLFPERRAYTVPYCLSPPEAALYEAVTHYVREEFNRAEALANDGRRGTVGFALMVLQRRLASSPEAIYQSLKRRRSRLEQRLQQVQRRSRLIGSPGPVLFLSAQDVEALDEAPAAEVEQVEQEVIDLATAARTVAELRLEIATLRKLEQEALIVRNRGQDRKWAELSRLLQDEREMFDRQGKRRKLVIFTEHRDTLTYLAERIRGLLGRAEAVVTIYGGMSRTARREAEVRFQQDAQAYVLVATDAAGEGINLQQAHLMINYDLPWNPNRLEQRFGRIHRIGQQEVCHLWNLVAEHTREGDVYLTLLRKLERARAALGGAVFDVLGQALEGVALRKLMIEAIRYGERADVQARLTQVVEGALDQARLHKRVQHEQALASEMLDSQQVSEVRQQMVRMQSQRFQPYYVAAFFQEAFKQLGGRLHQRETGRYEITRLPAPMRKEIKLNGRFKKRYKRVCFEKQLISQPNKPDAELICPGHALLDATVALILQRYRHLMAQGTILIDENDPSESCRLLFYVQHAIQDARPKQDGTLQILSQRLHFIEMWPDDDNRPPQEAGLAPYLDYRPLHEEEWPLIRPLLAQLTATERMIERVISHTRQTLLPAHLHEVQQERLPLIKKTQAAVKERLTKEIYYWDNRARQLKEKEAAAADKTNAHTSAKMNASKASQRADALYERLQTRMKELQQEAAALQAGPPVILGGAFIVPVGRLMRLQGQRKQKPALFARETKRVELAAMATVMATERALGYKPLDISSQNRGYDIESQATDGSGTLRFIEVKGRIQGAETVTITRNEILTAFNQPQEWILALVEVPPDNSFPAGDVHAIREDAAAYHTPANCPLRYLRQPFTRTPDHDVTSVNYNWRKLWARGTWPR